MADTEIEAPEEIEHCYRHPKEETRVHCTRCGRPICPQCMNPAPVGHHCPTCVAEARRDARQPLAKRARGAAYRLSRPGAITSVLIAMNITMFVAELVQGAGGALGRGPAVITLLDLGAMSPVQIALAGEWWRFVTAMFLHAGLWHVAVNCYSLFLLGNLIETSMGRIRFIAIYFVSGFLGSVASYWFSEPTIVGVGASGAVFGLLGAFVAYNWRRRELAMAAQNLRWVWTILVLNLVFAFIVPNIDHFAHMGGFVGGIAGGVAAEGFGRRGTRNAVSAAGFAVLIGIGMVAAMVRTDQIRELFAPLIP